MVKNATGIPPCASRLKIEVPLKPEVEPGFVIPNPFATLALKKMTHCIHNEYLGDRCYECLPPETEIGINTYDDAYFQAGIDISDVCSHGFRTSDQHCEECYTEAYRCFQAERERMEKANIKIRRLPQPHGRRSDD